MMEGEYLARRGLSRHAGRGSLWAMAVSAVIVGEFSGWNRGLIEGGFGGLFVALLLITLMYLCLCCSIAELGTAMPYTGGAYAYARAAFGPWGGFFAGLAQVIEYVLSIASIVVTIGAQLNTAFFAGSSISVPAPVLWLIVSAVFVFFNAYDTRLFFRSALVLSLGSLLVLVVFWVQALPRFDVAQLLAVPTETGSPWLPKGLVGIAWAAPFAIWFYLAVEQVPMAAEESRRPDRDVPAAMLLALATLAVAAVLTLFLNPGVPPGAAVVGLSSDPLLLGLNTVFPVTLPGLLVLLTLVGSLSSFHSIMYAAGRSIFCLSRAGYLPTALSVTSRTRHTPVAAVAAAAAASFVLASVVQYAPASVPLGAVLINMAVFGALLSYSLQFLSFLKLRLRHPDLVRPYRSPLGPTGAVTGLLIAVATGMLLFSNREYQLGLALCVLIYVIAAVEFAIAGRHRLRPAPEEIFAERLEAGAPREQVA